MILGEKRDSVGSKFDHFTFEIYYIHPYKTLEMGRKY